jgi:hypothetical protein
MQSLYAIRYIYHQVSKLRQICNGLYTNLRLGLWAIDQDATDGLRVGQLIDCYPTRYSTETEFIFNQMWIITTILAIV